jgi:hypothetical protein
LKKTCTAKDLILSTELTLLRCCRPLCPLLHPSTTSTPQISGHPVIAPHLGKLFGIRNGIDEEIWDPSIDEYIPRQYISDDVVQGEGAGGR